MWQGVSVFTRGRKHACEGQPCQDYGKFIKRLTGSKKEPVFLACIADGASFAKHGHLGARIAVRTALRSFSSFIKATTELNKDTLDQQFFKVISSIQTKQKKAAKNYKVLPYDFSTTVLFTLLTPNSFFSAQIGDGFILVKEKDQNKYDLVFSPAKGNHINETHFLPLMNSQGVQSTFKKKLVDFCLLSTDGIENVAFKMSTWEPSESFFSPLEKHARSKISQKNLERDLLHFLRGKKLQDKNQDDKTLLMGWRK